MAGLELPPHRDEPCAPAPWLPARTWLLPTGPKTYREAAWAHGLGRELAWVQAWLRLGMGASKGNPHAATAGSVAVSVGDDHLPLNRSYWQASITAVTGTPEGVRVLNSCLVQCTPADLGFCTSAQQGKHLLPFTAASASKPRGTRDLESLQELEGG